MKQPVVNLSLFLQRMMTMKMMMTRTAKIGTRCSTSILVEEGKHPKFNRLHLSHHHRPLPQEDKGELN